jgi:predicted transposase/invertase (TIGR01784 family)
MDQRVNLRAARAEGMEKGMEKEKTTIAKAMKAEGLDYAVIAKIIGLPVEQIRLL